MWSLFGKLALTYLYNKYGDPNRDKPPAPIQPVVFQPHTTSSLSAGKNCADSVDVMRLDLAGQTPHQPGVDEMSVHYIKRQYGLIAQIEWKASDAIGHELKAFVLAAAPCMAITKYGMVEHEGVNCYQLPPVAVLANLYGFWRGSIEYRLDFVCTRFHVGKLWVSFQPNCTTALTYAQSRACAGVEIDLSEDRRQHTFNVPYLADRPFWPRCYSSGVDSDVQAPPGIIVGYVVAPLTCTDVISSSIEMNIYVRGGEDLEFAVPCQPGIGLSFNPTVPGKQPSHSARPVIDDKVYAPCYVGSWHMFRSSEGAVLRWGTLTDEISQFRGFEQGYIYRLSEDYRKKWTDTWYFYTKAGQKVSLADCYFVPLDVEDGNGYIYCAVCETDDRAKLYWCDYDTSRNVYKYRYKDKVAKRGPLAPDRTHTADVGDTTKNNWSPNTSAGGIDVFTLVGETATGEPPAALNAESEYSFVGESDERQQAGSVVVLQPSPPPTGSEAMFGEEFMDLKDLCRRYQPYFKTSMTPPERFGAAAVILPAVPTGLLLSPDDPFQALCRDGIIPIVASGYRFYRGGLRFKLLSSWNSPGSVWLQVRPDRRFRGRQPLLTKNSQMDSMFNHGYATSFQATSINPTISIEVPFYQPGEYGLLQMTDPNIATDQASWSVSNGELVIGCVSHPLIKDNATKIVDIVILYSLADDCRFSAFQGFPPMVAVKDHL